MQAGGAARGAIDIALPKADTRTGSCGIQVAIDYEERVIDQPLRPSRKTKRSRKPVMATSLVAAMADDVAGEVEFAGPADRAIAVPGERWRAADADHLGALPGAAATSAAEARDRRALSGRPSDRTTVIALHEAA
jgi:hypothetical protein